jgi:hypothetical protein
MSETSTAPAGSTPTPHDHQLDTHTQHPPARACRPPPTSSPPHPPARACRPPPTSSPPRPPAHTCRLPTRHHARQLTPAAYLLYTHARARQSPPAHACHLPARCLPLRPPEPACSRLRALQLAPAACQLDACPCARQLASHARQLAAHARQPASSPPTPHARLLDASPFPRRLAA